MEKRNEKQILNSDIVSVNGVTKKLIIGPSVNSNEIVLRIMILEPGCSNLFHSHPFLISGKLRKDKELLLTKTKMK